MRSIPALLQCPCVCRACVILPILDEAQSLGILARQFAVPAPAECDKLPFTRFLLANSCLMAYGRVVMSLSETISSSDVCPSRMHLSKPEVRVFRRSSTRLCAAHAVPQPHSMRETIRGVRARRICTAWGVGHPDEP